jgi:hypothetical protein
MSYWTFVTHLEDIQFINAFLNERACPRCWNEVEEADMGFLCTVCGTHMFSDPGHGLRVSVPLPVTPIPSPRDVSRYAAGGMVTPYTSYAVPGVFIGFSAAPELIATREGVRNLMDAIRAGGEVTMSAPEIRALTDDMARPVRRDVT